jgi:hypothetical protein
MTNRLFLPILAAAVIAAAAGCGTKGEAAATWHGTMDTLPSGQVVVHNTAEPMWPVGSEWRIAEELRIGTVEGDGPDLFGEIRSLEVDPAGRIHVLETQANEIRVFDSDGAHIRTIGRDGGGPGEFNEPVLIQFGPDGKLWVVDPQNNRLSVFDTAGTYLEGHYALGGFIMFPWPGGFDTAGDYWAPMPLPSDDDFRIGLARFDRDLTPIDTIAVPTDPVDRDGFELRRGDSFMMAGIPYAPRFRWRRAPNGTLWGMFQEDYRFFQLTLDGDTLRSFTREFEPIPVTEADMEQAHEDLEWFTRQGGNVDWSKIPGHKPATDDFFFDDEGNIWVVPESPTGSEWQAVDVFDPEGRYLDRIDLPFRLVSWPYPIIRNGVMHAVIQDELEVPYVVRARIVRP